MRRHKRHKKRKRGYVQLLNCGYRLEYGLGMRHLGRIVPGGMIFHVLNRGNARSQIFEHDRDYEALA